MKKLVFYVLSFLFLVNAQGYCEELIEFTIEDMSSEAFESFRKGDLDGILCLNKGNKLPCMVSIEGDIVSLSDETSPFFNFRVGEKVYIKLHKRSFLFSSNKMEWKPFDEHFKGMLDLKNGEGDIGPVKVSLKNFKKGKVDKIWQLDPGATIPLELVIKGKLISFSEKVPLIQVQASRTIYVKVLKDDFLFSLDQVTWKTAQDQFKGMLGIAFGHEEVGLLGDLLVK